MCVDAQFDPNEPIFIFLTENQSESGLYKKLYQELSSFSSSSLSAHSTIETLDLESILNDLVICNKQLNSENN